MFLCFYSLPDLPRFLFFVPVMKMKIPPSINALLFDLGGVIMDLDLDRAKKELGKLGFREDMFHLQDTGSNKFLDLELGTISEETFYDWLCQILGRKVNHQRLEQAWNKMILGFRKEKIELLQKLKKRYPVYLLSNTNSIHVRYCNQLLNRQYGITSLEELFTQTFYSHLINLRKPQPEIFAFILEQIPCKASEILYFDDAPEHIETAATFGIRGILHPRNAPLELDE